MEFDTLIYTLNQIARETQDNVVTEHFSSLASAIAKNGITGLVPLEEGGLEDGVPFDHILAELKQGLEQASSSLDQGKIEDVYRQLLTYDVDGYVNE